MSSVNKVLHLGFALYGLGLTLGPDFGMPNYQTSGDTGPWGVNYTIYNALLDHPNATTNFPLPGPNINAAYPDAGPDEGWSWTISVTDDIPARDSDVSYYTEQNTSKVYTGSRTRLNAPPYLALPPDSSNSTANFTARAVGNFTEWTVCVQHWAYSTFSAAGNITIPDKWRQDDGSCSSIASADCIRDWEAAAVKSYQSGQCDLVDLGKILSCSGLEIIPKLGAIGHHFNSTNVGRWPGGHFDFITYGGELHDRGNVTAYNKTGSIPWPVLVVWGGWPINGPYSPPGSGGQINTTAKLTCVRAMNATEGSVTPGGISAGIGAHVALKLLWLVCGLSFSALLL